MSKRAATVPVRGKVIGQSFGKTGKVKVTEYGDRRQLVIGGTVQADLPKSVAGPGGAPVSDPMVKLIRGSVPRGESALVIGLGSGNTARGLSRAGFRVEAVEIEPSVIKYARKYFGYIGHAACDDGLAFLKRGWRVYDVILVDVFVGADTDARFLQKDAVELYRKRLAPGGLVALRLLDSPANRGFEKAVETLASGLTRSEHDGTTTRLFGSGVGDEVQNLYVLASPRELSVIVPKGVAVFPVRLAVRPKPYGAAGIDPLYWYKKREKVFFDRYRRACGSKEGKGLRAARRVLLAGHLSLVGEKRELSLELPHAEMGAYRVLLTGKKAAVLRKRLRNVKTFPTSGDLATDGDTQRTFKRLMGGISCMGHDTHYSPVAAAVEGRMVFRSQQNHYAKWRLRGQRPVFVQKQYEALLPFGGYLYELEVTKIHWTFDYPDWERFQKTKLSPAVTRAAGFIRKRDLPRAYNVLAGYVARFQSRFDPVADRFRPYAFVRWLMGRWRKRLERLSGKPTPKAASRICNALSRKTGAVPRGFEKLSEALEACGALTPRDEYERLPAEHEPENERRTNAARTNAARTDAARTDAARTKAARTSEARTNAARTDAARTDAARTSAARTDAARTDAARASAARADAASSTASAGQAGRRTGAEGEETRAGKPNVSRQVQVPREENAEKRYRVALKYLRKAPPLMKGEAIKALARLALEGINKKKIVSHLTEALRSSSPEVERRAALALISLGPSVVGALAKAVKRGRCPFKRKVARVLLHFGKSGPRALPPVADVMGRCGAPFRRQVIRMIASPYRTLPPPWKPLERALRGEILRSIRSRDKSLAAAAMRVAAQIDLFDVRALSKTKGALRSKSIQVLEAATATLKSLCERAADTLRGRVADAAGARKKTGHSKEGERAERALRFCRTRVQPALITAATSSAKQSKEKGAARRRHALSALLSWKAWEFSAVLPVFLKAARSSDARARLSGVKGLIELANEAYYSEAPSDDELEGGGAARQRGKNATRLTPGQLKAIEQALRQALRDADPRVRYRAKRFFQSR